VSVDWGTVYRSTYQELVRYLHRRVWDVDRAQDLAQETFVRAIEHEPDNPRAWLFRVATNLAKDESRSVLRKRKHLTLLKGEAEAAERAPPEIVEQVERQERAALVRAALESLAERDREVLQLWDAGLNYGEIAAQTGLAAGSIGTTLARARQRLADAYHALEGGNVAHG
jgi:RNA polymerase sigma-70 factor (ECF subfamily)